MDVTPRIGPILCAVDGCDRPAARGQLCWGHVQRRRLGKTIDTQLGDPRGGKHQRGLNARQLLKKAALAFADVDGSEADFDLAERRLCYAARVYARSLGWVPAKGKRWKVPAEIRPPAA